MFLIKPDEMERQMQVWCEQEIDNGGWTVIQTRRDGSVNFFRNWDNYKVTIDGLLILLCFISEPMAHPTTTRLLVYETFYGCPDTSISKGEEKKTSVSTY